MEYLLGIDSGSTVTKAVIFDEKGHCISVARRRIEQIVPKPHQLERDMTELWRVTIDVIKEALKSSELDAIQISVVSVTAHGDGVYLLNRSNEPLGNGILSLDTRAHSIVQDWLDSGIGKQALQMTGQLPHASAPSAILAWIKEYEPVRYSQIGSILACKDWLRFCLSGSLGTDFTEASTSFTDVNTQHFSCAVLNLFGLKELSSALPEVAESTKVVGGISATAARLTGLIEGTPIVAGLHDVTASAIGIGGHQEKHATIVAGTYSINETLTHSPRISPDWFCRNSIKEGLWHCMSISPASAANYDWFIDTFISKEREGNNNIHTYLNTLLDEGIQSNSVPLFHPYLFGSPHKAISSGSFIGLQGWHDRPVLFRAIIEGIIFNHRWHIEALAKELEIKQLHLTGGISRNSNIAQLFADILNLPVHVSSIEEPAAWGAALCGAVGIGLIDTPLSPLSNQTSLGQMFKPRDSAAEFYESRYHLFDQVTQQLTPLSDILKSYSNSRI